MPQYSHTTEVLLEQALGGEDHCLVSLLEVHSNYLKLLANTQMDARIRTRVSSSDIVQETLFEAHRDFPKFRGRSSGEFLAWLRKILVHNLARVVEQHVLAERRDVRREVAMDKLEASLERSAMRLEQVLADPEHSPSTNAIKQEQLLALADSLTGLSHDYRDVIVMRHLEGLSFKEVGDRLNRSEGAVRMLWLRAMDRLRVLLGERGMI